MPKPTANMFFVLGLPRSGTSLVAGVLAGLGVDLGEHFQEDTAWSPTGSYVDRYLNVKLLELRWQPSAFVRAEVLAMLAARRPPAAIKDHALCAVAGEVAELLGGGVAVIETVRDPAECVASLAAIRGSASIDFVMEHWGTPIEKLRGKLPWHRVEFRQALQPAELGRQLATIVGVPFELASVSHVDVGRHSRFSRDANVPCVHMGDVEIGRVPCPSIPGGIIKVYPCARHGRCTLGRPLDGVACCASCPDYVARDD